METEVAIVGGGPVGLSAALILGKLRVKVVLVERNASTSVHPRGHLVNARTMEIFRALGCDADVARGGLPAERDTGLAFASRLVAPDFGMLSTNGIAERDRARDASPCLETSCPQDVLEPILVAAARNHPSISLLFGTELTDLAPRRDHVRLICEREQDELMIDAHYVIGADGVRGSVREWLGIGMSGRRPIGRQIGIYFEADLWDVVRERPYLSWSIFNAQTRGVLIALDGRRRWAYNFAFDPETETPRDFTASRCEAIVRAAVGIEDLPLAILSVQPWRMQAQVADRFREGRVFIAGDAAHPLSPARGLGMNTGICDVHNLAWKLSLVLRGVAPASLLDSYQAEREPVARANVAKSAQSALKIAELSGLTTPDSSTASELGEAAKVERHAMAAIPSLQEQLDDLGRTFGQVYESAWVQSDGSSSPAYQIKDYEPSARPGHRAPHLWLQGTHGAVSTIDLFGDGAFILLTTPEGVDWQLAFATMAATRKLTARSWRIGAGADYVDSEGRFPALYGIGAGGMVLVRPDGYVAARAPGAIAKPREFLERALGIALDGDDPRRRASSAA